MIGDNVIVVNAEKNQPYHRYSNGNKTYLLTPAIRGGQPVGVKDLLAKHPERIIEKAVKGMLPKTKLGAAVLRNLKCM